MLLADSACPSLRFNAPCPALHCCCTPAAPRRACTFPCACLAPQVEGTHDPLEARIVLHGWFTQPAPFFAGEPLHGGHGGLPPSPGMLCWLLRPAMNALDPSLLHNLPAMSDAGSLSEEAATPALNACLDGLYAVVGTLPPAVGVVSLRLHVAGDTGRVADLRWLANTLVARPQAGEDPEDVCGATLATIAEHLLAATFPPSADGGDTHITLPFIFE